MQMRDLDFELLWWNRGLRRRDHTNQVHKYNLRICLRTKLDVQIYLQCSSMGCFTGSEALQFREKLLSAVRGLYFPAHSFEQQRKLALAQQAISVSGGEEKHLQNRLDSPALTQRNSGSRGEN